MRCGENALIGICSPAGPVKRDKLERAVRRIEESGYRVKLSANAFGKTGYLSASDEDRRRDLTDLFFDPEIDAVFCSRGGYGTSRLLERIDAKAIADSRKPFLGFFGHYGVAVDALLLRGICNLYRSLSCRMG